MNKVSITLDFTPDSNEELTDIQEGIGELLGGKSFSLTCQPYIDKQDDWISVDERLPDDNQLVIGVRDLVGGVQADVHNWDKWWKLNQYILWKPFNLPTPPKEQE